MPEVATALDYKGLAKNLVDKACATVDRDVESEPITEQTWYNFRVGHAFLPAKEGELDYNTLYQAVSEFINSRLSDEDFGRHDPLAYYPKEGGDLVQGGYDKPLGFILAIKYWEYESYHNHPRDGFELCVFFSQ